jgi:hypothetical protein
MKRRTRKNEAVSEPDGCRRQKLRVPLKPATMAAVVAAFAMTGSALADGPGKLPSNYKAIARDYIKTLLRDPDSAKITIPDQRPQVGDGIRLAGGIGQKSVPCYFIHAYVNGKNGFGGYSGVHRMVVFIHDGEAINCIDLDGHY